MKLTINEISDEELNAYCNLNPQAYVDFVRTKYGDNILSIEQATREDKVAFASERMNADANAGLDNAIREAKIAAFRESLSKNP